jgi:GNAT superfamily N-acetyltransferase
MTTVIENQASDAGQGRAIDPLRIAKASPEDNTAVLAMLGRCSRNTLFHRFHGLTDGIAYTDAQLQKTTDIVHAVWLGSACIALGVLVPEGDGAWELGVLVEDAWQRKGVGRRLVTSLLAEARRRDGSTLRAVVLGEDAAMLRPLRRLGPSHSYIDSGTVTLVTKLEILPPTNHRLWST